MNNYWVLFMANMNIARRNAGYNYMYITIYIPNNIIGIKIFIGGGDIHNKWYIKKCLLKICFEVIK